MRVRHGRDRHGRGRRGRLAPSSVPLERSGAALFDELVLDALERLRPRWSAQLAAVEFAVQDVPDPGRQDPDAEVALGRARPAAEGRPARVVVYRRPVELRAQDPDELAELVHDVVVEQVAELLGLDPGVVDPTYDDED